MLPIFWNPYHPCHFHNKVISTDTIFPLSIALKDLKIIYSLLPLLSTWSSSFAISRSLIVVWNCKMCPLDSRTSEIWGVNCLAELLLLSVKEPWICYLHNLFLGLIVHYGDLTDASNNQRSSWGIFEEKEVTCIGKFKGLLIRWLKARRRLMGTSWTRTIQIMTDGRMELSSEIITVFLEKV